MKYAILLLGVVVSTLAAPSETLTANPKVGQLVGLTMCASYIYSGCSWGDHKLQGPSYPGYNGDEAHGDCRTCVQGLPCHTDCGVSEEDESVQVAYKAAVDAARRGDTQALMDLMETADGYLSFNRDRGSVQLLSCDRSRVIANLSLASLATEELSRH